MLFLKQLIKPKITPKVDPSMFHSRMSNLILSQNIYSSGRILLSQILLKTLFSIPLVLLSQPSFGGGGTVVGGGGNSIKIEASTVEFMLKNNKIGDALVNYLDSIDVSKMQENTQDQKIIKKAFIKIFKNKQLKSALKGGTNYTFNKGCKLVKHDQNSFACTEVGNAGSPINFETNKISELYRNINSTELMIRLASLLLHEQLHHIQAPYPLFFSALSSRTYK